MERAAEGGDLRHARGRTAPRARTIAENRGGNITEDENHRRERGRKQHRG